RIQSNDRMRAFLRSRVPRHWLAALTLEDPDTGLRASRTCWNASTCMRPASKAIQASLALSVSTRSTRAYRLAAQSLLAKSFADGCSTMKTNINGSYYTLAALRELHDFY